MTYIVFGGTLNPAQLNSHYCVFSFQGIHTQCIHTRPQAPYAPCVSAPLLVPKELTHFSPLTLTVPFAVCTLATALIFSTVMYELQRCTRQWSLYHVSYY